MQRIHLIDGVVETHDIFDRGEARVSIRAVDGHRAKPRGVQRVGQVLHDGEKIHRNLAALDVIFLIPERPGGDAGMISVAQNETFHFVQRLGIGAHAAVLIQHQNAQPVAGIQQLRRQQAASRLAEAGGGRRARDGG